MGKTTLHKLAELGQSPWVDNITRGMITSGGLRGLIDKGIVGVTANPTIFEKALAGSSDYDDAISDLFRQNKSARDIYHSLLIEDVGAAADLFRPVFDKTNGLDGYISIEVDPDLAHDTETTIQQALEFNETLNRPNVFVKVPATAEGLPAIEELLYRGVNINVTLIFSVEVHKLVMEAYLSALERRVEEGKPVGRIASVASFFVSRVDTKVDKMLQLLLDQEQDPSWRQTISSLMGTAAINNSKLAYQEFLKAFGTERFERLKDHGARVQRPLWASTSTKNPAYRDVMYVEELIGPDTVNTMPDNTIEAFLDHGKVERTIDRELDKAGEQLALLEQIGISIKRVTEELTVEGVESFSKSFTTLETGISSKREQLMSGAAAGGESSLGGLEPQVREGLRRIQSNNVISRIWEHDPSVWKPDEAAQKRIENRLGWLGVISNMQEHAGDVRSFAQEVRDAGFTSVVLLGMGGSSLAPEVIHHVFGPCQKVGAEAYPRFFMLDSTEPGTIEAIERRIDLAKTLFIVSTKSGGTIETLSFYHYFRKKVEEARGERAGEHFVAITDPGTALEKLANEAGFRRIFLNMPDIGGRYSALSYFGIVPAALMGVDIDALLVKASEVAKACSDSIPGDNPGAWLGVVMAEAWKVGRDKVTIFTSPDLDSYGLWAEQLIAESTGKEGKGLVPVVGEPVGRPSAYGRDRLFVYLSIRGAADVRQEHDIQKLEAAGHPVVRLTMESKDDLGAEFFRWEFATAVAGCFIGIDPFDEPNVSESKENTQRLLDVYQQEGKLPEASPLVWGGVSLYGDGETLARAGWEGTLGTALHALFSTARSGDYVAMLVYMPTTGEHEELFQDTRVSLRDTLRVATTFGYGPRYLHSTGQLHKGGPNKGVFIEVTCDPRRDLPIPGQGFTFGTLARAQALGDLESLQKHGRRAIRLHIKGDHAQGVERIREAIKEAVEGLGI
ncbi:MAG: bifunctional transaldolase/phosoglucose isomerase [Chloroflexia bacterium]